MNFIKPKRLQKGDTIAVLTPSWGGPSAFPHVYESGISALKNLGFKIKEYKTTKEDSKILYNNPKLRADDINSAFADKEVNGVITTIGGDDSIRVLPYINRDSIINNPKFFMGYSDAAILNTYFNQLGLVTYNGPTIMAGFAQLNNLPKEFQEHIESFLFSNYATYQYKPYKEFCQGYPDWTNEENKDKINELIHSKGRITLQGDKTITGKLFGGCIEVLEFMKATKFWPKEEFWNEKILFLETSEDKPSPESVKWMLRNYGMQGILNKISGLIFARARDYTDNENKNLFQNITDVVSKEFNNPNLPILANFDFGHTDPQVILPLGIDAELNPKEKTVKLLESPFV